MLFHTLFLQPSPETGEENRAHITCVCTRKCKPQQKGDATEEGTSSCRAFSFYFLFCPLNLKQAQNGLH